MATTGNALIDYTKWLLWGVVKTVLAIILVVGVSYVFVSAYQYMTHDRHVARLSVTVRNESASAKKVCSTPMYPVFVGVVNNSSRVVTRVTVEVKAHPEGFSTNAFENYAETPTYEKILKPGEGWGDCWGFKLKEPYKDKPEQVVYKSKVYSADFDD